MSTPNPALVAAAPILITVVEDALAAFSTITTGDPLTVAARVEPAAQIFLGQLMLLLPTLAGSEFGALQADINAKGAAIIAHLKSLSAPPTPAG